MKIREIDKDSDLKELYRWYTAHGWEKMIPAEMFPPRGFMVEDHAAIWLYADLEVGIGWIAHMVTNPRKNVAMAMRALYLLFEKVEDEATCLGLKALTQTISHSSLKKLAKQHNYIEGDVGLTSYWKAI